MKRETGKTFFDIIALELLVVLKKNRSWKKLGRTASETSGEPEVKLFRGIEFEFL